MAHIYPRLLPALLVSALIAGACAHAPTGAESCSDAPLSVRSAAGNRPLDPFPSAVERQRSNASVPVEIAGIRRGAYSLFVGAHLNDGRITWYGFDLDRRLFIAVLGHAGRHLERLPKESKLAESQLVRLTDAAGYRRGEFVTVSEATAGQAAQFSCLANSLVSTKKTSEPLQPLPTDTLVSEFTLLLDGKTVTFPRTSSARQVQEQLEKFIAQPLQDPILRAYQR
jgi:hypothetical protein